MPIEDCNKKIIISLASIRVSVDVVAVFFFLKDNYKGMEE